MTLQRLLVKHTDVLLFWLQFWLYRTLSIASICQVGVQKKRCHILVIVSRAVSVLSQLHNVC